MTKIKLFVEKREKIKKKSCIRIKKLIEVIV